MLKTSSNGLKVPFGKKGTLLFAPGDITESGLACGCTCPGCGAKLLIRQGTKRRHFAHYRALGTNHCVESAIHQAAIQVLLGAKWVRVPEKTVTASIRTKAGAYHSGEHLMAQARTIRFDDAAPEVHINIAEDVSVRPDVVGYRNGRQLLVEMCFRHAVDPKKLTKLLKLGSPVIEVYLSDLDHDTGFDAIRERVLEDTSLKKWLVYPGEDEAKTALVSRLKQEGDEIDERNLRAQKAALKQQQEKEQERLDRLHRIATAHEQYRNITPREKEQKLRMELGISNAWPRYLRIANDNNRTIDALPHLWQASLFQRFIYKKPRYKYTFDIGQAVLWVNSRFGLRTHNNASAREAIRKFFAYLGGCGFIERNYNPYGEDNYKVLHNKLEPPPRIEVRSDQKGLLISENQYDIGTTFRDGVIGRDWEWKEHWPSYDDAMKAATKWICMNREHYIDIIKRLYTTHKRPIDPRTFAEMMVQHGIPARETISFLIETGLAQ